MTFEGAPGNVPANDNQEDSIESEAKPRPEGTDAELKGQLSKLIAELEALKKKEEDEDTGAGDLRKAA